MTEKIQAAIIIEMMGRPMDYLQKASEDLVEAVAKEKGIRITSKVLHDLKKVENKDAQGRIIPFAEDRQLYSTFAELEIEVVDVMTLLTLCFKYLPSHVEIIEPSNFAINNFEFSGIINELVTKLHNYDTIAKSALMQNQVLAQKFIEMQKQGSPEVNIQPNPASEEQQVKEESKKTKKENKK